MRKFVSRLLLVAGFVVVVFSATVLTIGMFSHTPIEPRLKLNKP